MKAFNGYEEVKAATERVILPKGGYVVKIKAAQVKTYQGQNGDFEKLEIAFDIAEGEYKGFFQNDFDNQNTEDKRWKGVLRQYIPTDDGSEKDARTKSYFKAMIEAIEDSNVGYHWDWDEKKLKGKIVGCIFRLEEWEWDGKNGWRTAALKFIEAQKIRDGKFKVPNDKPLNTNNQPTFTQLNPLDVNVDDDEDLPF